MNLKRQLRQGALLAVLFGTVVLVVWNMPQAPVPEHPKVLER